MNNFLFDLKAFWGFISRREYLKNVLSKASDVVIRQKAWKNK